MRSEDIRQSRSGSRSRWTIAVLVTAATATLLALAVFVLPTPLARWALSRQIEDAGISVSGLETLDVDLAQGEVWIGPVQFAGSGGEPAQLVSFGFDASLRSLLQRRVLFDRMIVRGLDIHVRRVINGPITINGITLTDYLPEADATDPGSAADGAAPASPGRNGSGNGSVKDGGWGAGIDTFEFRDSRLLLTSAGGGRLVVNVADLELRGFRTWAPEKPGTFALEGEANGIAFSLEGEARPFADVTTINAEARVEGAGLDRIRRFTGPLAGLQPHQGRMDAQFAGTASLYPDGRIEGRADGSAQLEGIHIAKPGLLDIRTPEGQLQFDLSLALDGADTLRLQGHGETRLQQVKAAGPEGATASLETGRVTFSGLDIVRTGDSGGTAGQVTPLAGKVDLELGGVDAALPRSAGGTSAAQPMRLGVRALQLDVNTPDDAQSDVARPLRLTGSVKANEISASIPGAVAQQPVDAGVQTLQASLHEISATPGGADGLAWQVQLDAEAAGVTARVGEGDTRAEVPRIALESVTAGAGAALSAKSIEVESPEVWFSRRFIDGLKPSRQGPEQTPARPATPILLGRATLIGSGTIQFKDATVQPSVHLRAAIDTLSLRDIDTGNPQQRSTFELAGTLGEHSQLGAEGWATPFAGQRDFDVSANARAVPLHVFSGYAAQTTGMVIDSGTLEADVDATATGGQLNAVVSGVVRNLDLVEAETNTGGSFPAELVFALLEDSERKIALRVPVSGNLNAPQFDLSDAVSQALSGAIRKVALSVLDLVFLPKTVTQTLFGSEDTDQISRPVTFSPGSAELGPEARQVTTRLVDLLKGRPKLAIQICGNATAQDLSAMRTRRLNQQMLRAAEAESAALPENPGRDRDDVSAKMRDQLERLAAERTRAVRQRLIAGGVPASQLGECRPSINAADRSEPGVVVSLQVS